MEAMNLLLLGQSMGLSTEEIMKLAKMIPLPIHDHLMTPVKSGMKANCCGIKFEAISDGYYCAECDEFFHMTCSSNVLDRIWIDHPLGKSDGKCVKYLHLLDDYDKDTRICYVCRGEIGRDVKSYGCGYCKSKIHLNCFKYPPPEIIEVPQNHEHQLKLEKVESCFTCAACGKDGKGYSYKCDECHLAFHVNCQKHEAEVNHSSHTLHPLKLLKGEPPAYTRGKCRLCGGNLGNYEVFYHCSTCNFSLDLHCVLNPPPLYPQDRNTHDHKLTLVPQAISFTCTVCGLSGDRSPVVCLQCNFTAHNDCSGFPWVININRHDHRVSRTSLLGVVDAVCGICQKKMDWSCGGYSCQRCPSYVYHTKCATREDVSDCKEMKGEPEEDEDVESFTVIDENTIQHFGHERHNLILDKYGIFTEKRPSCEACLYQIHHDPFYSCEICGYFLHERCAKIPKRKRHMLSNQPYNLAASQYGHSKCNACGVRYTGFSYRSEDNYLDVRCASVSEPFVHKSHLDHPLFYTSPLGVCSACNKASAHVLRCVEEDCGYTLDFKCALLPYEVKHRVDDNFLSLCFGEKDASGKYWCHICEKETYPKTWFYTSKDCELTLHIDCVLGDFRALEPGRIVTRECYQGESTRTFRNNSMSRPLCCQCKSRCVFPIILKVLDKPLYYCSIRCFDGKTLGMYPDKDSIW